MGNVESESGWITGGDDEDALYAMQPNTNKGLVNGLMVIVQREGQEKRTQSQR